MKNQNNEADSDANVGAYGVITRHLRFDCLWALYERSKGNEIPSEYDDHPQKVMEHLGITYAHSTPQSVADQWWFWGCKNVPDELPKFLKPLDLDPMEQAAAGRNLTEAEAIKIRDAV